MKIESIELENFRGFRGNHKISFSTDEEKSTTLIIAENGVGKSTILNSIYWCFYGSLTENSHKKGVIRHQKPTSKHCSVKIRVTTENPLRNSDKEFLIQRKYKSSTDSDLFVWEVDQHGSNHKKHANPEQVINHFLPQPLSKYFLFYGEGLQKITEEASLLKEAIEDFQGLTAANAAARNIQDKLSEYLKKSTTQTNKSSKLTSLQKKEETHKKAIEKLEKDFKNEQLNHSKIEKDYKKIDEQYNNSSDKEIKRLSALRIKEESNLKTAKNDLKGLQDARIKIVQDSVFKIMHFKYVDKLDDFFSKSKYKGAIPFMYHSKLINHILKEELCICERELSKGGEHYCVVESKLDTAETQDLRDRASKIELSSEGAEKVNLEFDILIDKSDDMIADKVDQIKILISAIAKISKDLESLGKPNSGENLEEKRNKLYKELGESQFESGQLKQKITILKNERKQMLSDITKLVDQSSTSPIIAAHINFLSQAHNEIEALIKDERKKGRDFIFNDMNKSLKDLSAGDHSFIFRKVDGVETYLPEIVKNDGDQLILSDGEQLLKQSLFFASALIKHSRRRKMAQSARFIAGTVAPIVADAPFGFLDPDNNGIAAQLLFDSSDQLIIMLNSKSFSGEVENLFLNQKKSLGKLYVMHKKFTGSQNNKKLKPVKIFGDSFNTASYENEFEESTIEELDIKI